MAVNDPKWHNGSVALVQADDYSDTVRWGVGSVYIVLEYVAVGGGLSIPVAMMYYNSLRRG